MTSNTATEISAEQVYGWLRALHPKDPTAEREELLAAGFAGHTVLALYPMDFTAIIPALAAHLRATSLTSLLHQSHALREQRVKLARLLAQLKEIPAGARQQRQGIRLSADALSSLNQTLYEELQGAAVKDATGTALDCGRILWRTFMLITMRDLMTAEQQVEMDAIVRWLGANLLKLAQS